MGTIGGPAQNYQTYPWEEVIHGDGVLLEFAPNGFHEDGTPADIGVGVLTLDQAVHKMENAARYQNTKRKREGKPQRTFHILPAVHPEDPDKTYVWAIGHDQRETQCNPEGECYDWPSRIDA